MKYRVLIAVGGSGGHIYPAISLAQKLKAKDENISVMFVGGGLKSSHFFDSKSFPCSHIATAHFPLKKPWKLLKSCFKICLGILQSRKLIKKFSPDVVVGFGSYHSLPALLAAKVRKVPIVLHEGNAFPGKVNRLLAKYAKVTGFCFPEAEKYLNGKAKRVEMPLREGVYNGVVSKTDSQDFYGLDPELMTILVVGGSQGALSLNRLVVEAISNYQGKKERIQIIHLAGTEDEKNKAEKAYRSSKVKACVKSFENSMEKAWSAADLVISRSGAGAIAEALEFEVPSILIPYPFATDKHQTKNALHIANVVRGGLCYEESNISPQSLSKLIFDLLEGDSSELNMMRSAIQEYKSKIVQSNMCSLVTEIIPLRGISL